MQLRPQHGNRVPRALVRRSDPLTKQVGAVQRDPAAAPPERPGLRPRVHASSSRFAESRTSHRELENESAGGSPGLRTPRVRCQARHEAARMGHWRLAAPSTARARRRQASCALGVPEATDAFRCLEHNEPSLPNLSRAGVRRTRQHDGMACRVGDFAAVRSELPRTRADAKRYEHARTDARSTGTASFCVRCNATNPSKISFSAKPTRIHSWFYILRAWLGPAVALGTQLRHFCVPSSVKSP